MSIIKLTSDWHIGAKRSSGATPASNAAMQQWMLNTLAGQLDPTHPHLIAGDLLDAFTVDTSQLLLLHSVLSTFLDTGQELCVMRGNHDHSPRSSQVSSFDLLMTLLERQYDNLTVAREVTDWHQFILVPHLPNNELLKVEVERLHGVKNKVVVFHANYDNHHAADSQNSLNVTDDMLDPLIENGCVVVFGHEHPYRVARQGKVLVIGNGVPSSIADCVTSGYKHHAIFDGLHYTAYGHLAIDDVFARVYWRDLGYAPEKKFIRVQGSASAAEASEVVNAIAALRQRSNAYVIANAVEVEGISDFQELTEMSMEKLTQFDVLHALLEELDDREGAVVKELLGVSHV